MVLPVNFTCTEVVWVTHLERITCGKLLGFLFWEVEPHSFPFRAVAVLYLAVTSHSTQEVFLGWSFHRTVGAAQVSVATQASSHFHSQLAFQRHHIQLTQF